MTRRIAGMVGAGVAVMVAASCVEIGTNPETPAAIELPPFPSPSVVLGDTLRDFSGAVVRLSAIVRNIQGDIIADAPVTFLYADYARDSALIIDGATGIVRAARASTGDARVAARVGGALQVLRILQVTTRPDTLSAVADTAALLTTTLPDTARASATANRSANLRVLLQHREADIKTGVNAYLVKFEVVSPANPGNDTTAVAYIVNDNGRPSQFDTTDASGNAGRQVRVHSTSFPSDAATAYVVVRATTNYRGVPVVGAPVRIVLPVKRGT